MPSDCARTWPITLQFDGQDARCFRFEIEDDGPPNLKGRIYEVPCDDLNAAGEFVSELKGSCRPGKSDDNGPKVMDLTFTLDDETIFLAGRVRGRHFDGRFLSYTPESIMKAAEAAKAGTFFEPGETGTGGGSQQTLLLHREEAAGAEAYPSGGETAPEEQ